MIKGSVEVWFTWLDPVGLSFTNNPPVFIFHHSRSSCISVRDLIGTLISVRLDGADATRVMGSCCLNQFLTLNNFTPGKGIRNFTYTILIQSRLPQIADLIKWLESRWMIMYERPVSTGQSISRKRKKNSFIQMKEGPWRIGREISVVMSLFSQSNVRMEDNGPPGHSHQCV